MTIRFAEQIVQSRPNKSKEALAVAKKGLLDFIASSFASRQDKGIQKLLAIIEQEGGKPIAPIIGQNVKASGGQAALVNGFIGHVLDFDDVHSDVRGHPSTVLLPTLFSIAATDKVDGMRFLEAYIVGVEVMARLGKAIGKGHYLRGWHNTGTLGTIAATAAGAFLKGFSVEQMGQAIGFAATQASGLRVQFGTETKPLHAGIAAQSALFSIQLTEQGFGGVTTALDGVRGFFSVYGEGPVDKEEILLNGWGESWRILNPGLWFKLYPFCSAASHAADAAIELSHKKISPSTIRQIRVLFPPDGDAALIHKQPKTGEMGRFSVEYVIALILLGYPLILDHFQNRPIPADVQVLMERIERQHDGDIKPDARALPEGRFTIIDLTTMEGESFQSRIDFPKGSPGNPVTLEELKRKFVQAVDDDLHACELLKALEELETAFDLKRLLALL